MAIATLLLLFGLRLEIGFAANYNFINEGGTRLPPPVHSEREREREMSNSHPL
ncbi:hypothetical protein Ddye_019222 [Dipteronia dyeriana]|uniref:Uncharacterized protein n=1 Tax=Dipteronia dyeriana TaxID=168575 RepID=A0AAD9WVI4_9ROSI|nr:hypothetical protein Ddye_019222 [Dipteronia dyeriana]